MSRRNRRTVVEEEKEVLEVETEETPLEGEVVEDDEAEEAVEKKRRFPRFLLTVGGATAGLIGLLGLAFAAGRKSMEPDDYEAVYGGTSSDEDSEEEEDSEDEEDDSDETESED